MTLVPQPSSSIRSGEGYFGGRMHPTTDESIRVHLAGNLEDTSPDEV
jgi:hypothetical protein